MQLQTPNVLQQKFVFSEKAAERQVKLFSLAAWSAGIPLMSS